MDLELEKTLIIGEQIPCSVCCVQSQVSRVHREVSLLWTIELCNMKRSCGCSIQVNSLHVNNWKFKMKLILWFVSQFLVNLMENLNHHIVYHHEDNINWSSLAVGTCYGIRIFMLPGWVLTSGSLKHSLLRIFFCCFYFFFGFIFNFLSFL